MWPANIFCLHISLRAQTAAYQCCIGEVANTFFYGATALVGQGLLIMEAS